MNRYKVPNHIRRFVKKELMDYKTNVKIICKFESGSYPNMSTRSGAVLLARLSAIDKVFDRLNEEDRSAAELIFFQHYSQVGAEIATGLSRAMYYNVMNKVIYLVAKEMELI